MSPSSLCARRAATAQPPPRGAVPRQALPRHRGSRSRAGRAAAVVRGARRARGAALERRGNELRRQRCAVPRHATGGGRGTQLSSFALSPNGGARPAPPAPGLPPRRCCRGARLAAVACEVEERDTAGPQRGAERLHGVEHGVQAGVQHRVDFEADVTQRCADVARVVHRIAQRAARVVGNANAQRHALRARRHAHATHEIAQARRSGAPQIAHRGGPAACCGGCTHVERAQAVARERARQGQDCSAVALYECMHTPRQAR